MRFISWNVNGIRATLKKGLPEFVAEIDADFICLQESKAKPEQVDFAPEGYTAYWHSAVKPGYAGTIIYARQPALSEQRDFGLAEHDGEGRVLTLEYPDFYLVNTYTPNSQNELRRLDYRMQWQDAYRDFLSQLDKQKPVIVCGDLNVAHQEIDLKNPKTNRRNAGFTDEERQKMTELLSAGFIDSYRHFHPDQADAYTWWSHRANSRARNVGWRIDYFLISQRLLEQVEAPAIYPEVLGSDHCPVGLDMKF